MGTRATVRFYNEKPSEKSKAFLNVYYQFDGYYDGVGLEVADWLKSKTIIYGIRDQRMEDGFANGIGCLAAQFIANQKDRIGGVYINTDIEGSESYDYNIWVNELGAIEMQVDDFIGYPHNFNDFIKSTEED